MAPHLGRVAQHVDARDRRPPGVGQGQRGQDPHRGRLAGAVGPEQPEDRAGRDARSRRRPAPGSRRSAWSSPSAWIIRSSAMDFLTCRSVDLLSAHSTPLLTGRQVESEPRIDDPDRARRRPRNDHGPRTTRTTRRRPGVPDDPDLAIAVAPTDTRERILDVALDLFTEQGFDGTSLRQIAEQLGVTKAALYYHFESKDDILMALHLRLHEFGKGGPDAAWGRSRSPWSSGASCSTGRRPDAGPAQDLPHARAEPGRPREAAPQGPRGRARGHPEPVPPGAGRPPGAAAGPGARWRPRSASSSRACSSRATRSPTSTNEELGDMLRDVIRDVLQG